MANDDLYYQWTLLKRFWKYFLCLELFKLTLYKARYWYVEMPLTMFKLLFRISYKHLNFISIKSHHSDCNWKLFGLQGKTLSPCTIYLNIYTQCSHFLGFLYSKKKVNFGLKAYLQNIQTMNPFPVTDTSPTIITNTPKIKCIAWDRPEYFIQWWDISLCNS